MEPAQDVARILAGLLAIDAAALDWDKPLHAYGLSSLKAARLLLHIQAELGVDIPMEQLGQGITARELDRLVRGAAPAAAAPAQIQRDARAPMALTPLQQAYLVGKNPDLSPDPVGCQLYREFHVPGLDVGRLAIAWRRVVSHHEALRTVLTPEGKQTWPESAPETAIAVHDASRRAEVRERLTRRCYAPGENPMWTVEVTGADTVHLGIDAMLIDGHGMAVLLDHWWRAYTSPAEPLPAAGVTLRECLGVLEDQAGSAKYQTDMAYWKERLEPLAPGPKLGLLPASGDDARDRLTATVRPPRWQALCERAEQIGVSPSSLVLTVFTETLGRIGERGPVSLVLTTNCRTRLPGAADQLIGPFTDSAVFVTENTLDRPFDEAARYIHRLLWTDLGHAGVSGVMALRERARAHRGEPETELPVVFTSLLGVGPDVDPRGFAGAVTYAASRTSGVALDHQMWEHDGALCLQWDVAAGRFPAGTLEALFAAFLNALDAAGDGEGLTRPLNELQKAYYVARAMGVSDWDGCQVYHSFHVRDLDLDRLEAAWLRLMRGYDALRSVLTHEGDLLVRPRTPDRWWIPDIQGAPEGLAERLVSRAYPLGRWPQSDLWVTRTGPRDATVHCVLDLTLADGRSVHFLLRELMRCYADPSHVLKESAPWQDFERDAVRTSHWRTRLADMPPGPRLAPETGDRRRRRLQGRVTGWRAVKAWARSRGLQPDMLLLAALTDTLSSRCAEPFTVPVVRWTDHAEPFRPGEFTALSWVTASAGDMSLPERARDHQLQIEPDLSLPSLSGLAELRKLVMKRRRRGWFDLPVVYTSILELEELALPAGITHGPWLTCTPDVSLDSIAIDEGDELRFYWDGLDAAFPDGALDTLFAKYRRRIEELVEVYAWNDTEMPFPADRLPHSLFEHQAALRPDAIALRHRGGTVTFGALNEQANRIAWTLREHGIGPECVVGISLRRGPDMIAAVLGVLKAGGLYLPVDPGLPAERAGGILSDAGAKALLTTSVTAAWPLDAAIERVDLSAMGPARADNPPLLTCPDSTAYVIYTSGSTGKPKGVAVAHRAVLNLLHWAFRTFGFTENDCGLTVTSLGFDLSVFDILCLLCKGGSLYVADDAEQKDPALLLEALLDNPITFWNSAPTTLNQLCPLLPDHLGEPGTFDLRLVFLSGDYTPLTLPDEVRAVFPNAHIVSLGGATEATVWSNYFRIGMVDPSWRSIPYGRPMDNAQYYILDEQLRPCPPGTEGDLYIGGECLSLGYWKQPTLTEQRFIPDPFAFVPGARMYRTGDRAAFFADGTMCFLGRADNQVKIRGFRVELGEIEHRLRQHPSIKDAVVVVQPDPGGDRKPVAYVIAQPGTTPSAKELRAHAAVTLPDYMVPAVVAFLDSFPGTSNGKLDRAALPWPVAATPEPLPAAPAVDLTQEISDLFAEQLGLSEVDPELDLWDQGATSFTMVQVSGALQRRYGQRVPVAVLVADPTAAAIASYVAAAMPSATVPAAALSSATVPPTPLSSATVPRVPLSSATVPGAGAPLSTPSASVEPLPTVPTPADSVPQRVDFFSAEQRAAFKASQPHLRPLPPATPAVALDDVRFAGEQYDWRSSHREFGAGPVSRAGLSRLLGLLRTVSVGSRERALYPSAGDTYAVQVYLHAKDGGVDGLESGLYYYHPGWHSLCLVSDGVAVERSAHFVYNRAVFDRAGFEIYLIGKLDAIEPVYERDAERFLLLEAGYLGQLLMMGQAQAGIGLCPVGTLAFDQIRGRFGLDDRHVFLHAFFGGAIEPGSLVAPNGEVAAFGRAPAPRAAEIAVVGVSGRYPSANDPEALWRNLEAGRTAIGAAPSGRREVSARRGGYLSDVDSFDSLVFHVSPREASTLDPQLRLLMETVWECLENAGHTAESLRRTAPRVGVFVGVMWNDFQHVGADELRETGGTRISAVASDIPNRLSYYFGFQGPSLAVNTSCSSALTAIHLAVESLRRGECDAAIVGAANLFAHPYHIELLEGLDLLGAGNDPGAFAAGASGWTPGEGVGAVLLRPSDAAIRDRDNVYGIIETTRVGHAGHGGRFAAPSAPALAESIRAALSEAGHAPGDIGYVECAAAGAALADAAELEALGEVFTAPVPIGTIKPNLGHLEAASGMSQLTKVLWQLRHGLIAPTVTAASPTPMVEWDRIGPRVVSQVEGWPVDRPRRALVNALGATGSYAHLVLRAAPAPQAAVPHAGPHTFILSAATPEQLNQAMTRLRQALSENDSELADIAYTLQTGRVPMAQRFGVVCATRQELIDALTTGISVPATEPLRRWLAGEDVDWQALWAHPARRVPLPAYPFARERHDRPIAIPVPVSAGLEDHLKRLYSEVSGIPAERLGMHVPLENYGLDSHQVTELNARLERDFQETSRTLFFEHRDLAGIAGHLQALGRRRPEVEAAPLAVSEDIAIVGIAGRYPDASDLDTFWRNLSEGRDSIGPVPADRVRPGWPTDLMWGGFLDGVDRFDPLFFGITPRDAALMDPQERLFLQTAWETLEDAGYPPTRLHERHGSRVGVFVGVMHNEYPFFGVEQTMAGQPTDSGSAIAGIANRVSYFLNLHGPSLAVDTMCSSSLTAVHLAVQSLRLGECEVALAGGVNLSLHPNKFLQQRRMRMTSTDHRCRAFGAGGDGFAPGEGAGAVALKPLSRAIADGDRIHAVIKSTVVNHGGKTNGYLVPNPVAQGHLVREAWRKAGVTPDTIGYVEAHGTGTELGDPIEISGLAQALGSLAPGSVPIGSVKSNIGHLEAAAGIAGLTKVVLQMRHGKLVPSLHAERLNPNIDWTQTPFAVQRSLAPWPEGTVRRAGVSAFGAGGSNAHVVVEAYSPDRATAPRSRRPQLIVLSARDEEALTASAQRLAGFLRRNRGGSSDGVMRELTRIAAGELPFNGATDPQALSTYLLGLAAGGIDLAGVAHTLQVGREPLRERLAIVATDTQQLVRTLERLGAPGFAADPAPGFLRGDVAAFAPDVVRGRAPLGAAPGEPWRPSGVDAPASELLDIARHWVAGGAVDWQRLHIDPAIVSLPHYPFASMQCWLPSPSPAVRLDRREWAFADTAPPPPSIVDGPIICVYQADSAAHARSLAERLSPATVLLAGDVGTAEALLAEHGTIAGWIDLTDFAGADTDSGWQARFALLQRAIAARHRSGTRVIQVTRGLQNLAGAPPRLSGARLAGFVRMLGAEHAAIRPTVLDVDADCVTHVVAEWNASDTEVCYRAGRRYLPVLTPLSVGATIPPRLDPTRTYLITGGTRGLGAAVAEHLVSRGARYLAVTGIQPQPAPETVRRWRELEARGITVMTYLGSLADRAGVDDFLGRVRMGLGPIGGIVHCAGLGSRGRPSLAHKDVNDVAAVLSPKADGLEVLTELCLPDGPDFFVLFSSVSAAVPALAAGVADYAAANTFMDLFAGVQTRLGRAIFRSVNWPVWLDGRPRQAEVDACAKAGVTPLSLEQGMAILDLVLALPEGTVLMPAASVPAVPPVPLAAAPVPVPSPTAVAAVSAGAVPLPAASVPAPVAAVPALVALSGAPAATVPVAAVPALVALSGAPSATAGPARWLVDIFARTLGIPASDLDPAAAFGDLGVESVMLAELLEQIEAHLERRLEPATLLDHPTLVELDAHLSSVAPVQTAAPVHAPAPVVHVAPDRGPDRRIAVIGLACSFPGAPDVDTFWKNLVAGQCAVTEVPVSRWDAERLYRPEPGPGTSISKWGGFVDGVELFDPGYFGMTEDEARCLDPGIRMFLEGSVNCLRDAGYDDSELRGRDIGVFVGARMSNYRRRVGIRGGSSGLGTDQNFIAARVAHQFDFHGPNLVVDSACSSALVSVHLAIQSLLTGESEMALAGGVEVLLDEEPYLEFSAAKALSPSGRCFTFDQRANGFVPGEGCGVLLLKPLAKALADGDRVHAVINAAAVNNDGHTMGLTTPNPQAQGAVVRRALAASGVRAEDIGMLEAHGTATMIGDPIELRALTDVYRESTDRTGFCAIGSVKSNIGHLLSAAGIAGLIKVILSLENGRIPATLFCDTPNPRFDFSASPFTPNRSTVDWPEGRRAAGVSAFGLGGTNAHVIATALDAADRHGAATRKPLPPARFQRQRLWLDRAPSGPGPASGEPASPRPEPARPQAVPPAVPVSPRLTASLIDLRFTQTANGKN